MRRWLDELGRRARVARFASFDALAAHLQRKNPRLDPARARSSRALGARERTASWQMRQDPAHKRVNPVLYRARGVRGLLARDRGSGAVRDRAPTSPHLAALGEDATVTRVSSLIRTLESCTIDAAGHMIHHDQPAALAAQIDAFLRRT